MDYLLNFKAQVDLTLQSELEKIRNDDFDWKIYRWEYQWMSLHVMSDSQ